VTLALLLLVCAGTGREGIVISYGTPTGSLRSVFGRSCSHVFECSSSNSPWSSRLTDSCVIRSSPSPSTLCLYSDVGAFLEGG
jgi:hypothetical protein